MNSIRRRLLWGGALTIGMILALVLTLSYRVIQHEADEVFSARLATSARVLEALTARQLETASITAPIVIDVPQDTAAINGHDMAASERLNTGHPYENKLAFQVWSEDGQTLLAMSESAPTQPLGPLASGFHDMLNPDDSGWHVFVLKSGGVWIHTAEKSEVREEMITELALSVLSPLLLGSMVLLVLFHGVASFSLKPLHQITHHITQRQASDLAPLPSGHNVKEINSLRLAINRWLEQLRLARQREQEFIRAAAHEIRTPIAAIQIHIQNAKQGRDSHEINASLNQAEEATRRTAKLADQLLTLSRLNASGESVFGNDPVRLSDVTSHVSTWMQPLLDARGLQMVISGDPSLTTHIQPSMLERLIRNLVENAAQYGHAPGTIDVQWVQTDHALELSIANDGPCIPDAEKTKVFIPYYRLNGHQGRGSGLGLAIVDEMVRQMNGQVWIEDKVPGQGVKVIVRWEQTHPG